METGNITNHVERILRIKKINCKSDINIIGMYSYYNVLHTIAGIFPRYWVAALVRFYNRHLVNRCWPDVDQLSILKKSEVWTFQSCVGCPFMIIPSKYIVSWSHGKSCWFWRILKPYLNRGHSEKRPNRPWFTKFKLGYRPRGVWNMFTIFLMSQRTL